ncbi:hypothetical protein BCV39_06080 [Vibrio sp. 10N.286.55.E10]|uniref:hypothetical protein n=1 Tax=unclassified Vibrio TaxID=2614977 RepID=UPI000C82E870|nr:MULTISPECIES: hypothetical protein [unclassified Vibrio]CAK3879222.1 Peptidase MA-like domain-containing protein [Vibrio crassostreae]PME32177.1 hypothetical protein BCV39_06080 [Vibrio sp. 10N.286.55.E10]PME34331.1 hypothetical protein BCV40_10955 [Vibrio sp. 10N.286.55.E12]PME59282.1 hypothetical protein BCV32_08130 [Vibrio sp. 10N.286.55.C11]PMI22428.1 hypothetical protein BCU50_10440 [Vibrio sp. 10N.286.46.E10]
MKRYPPKSIVTFLFLTMSVLVLVVAFVLQIRGEQACDSCYESDKGQFKFVLYDGTSPAIIPSIYNELLLKQAPLMKSFGLDSIPVITVRVWQSQKAYLDEQERSIGQRYAFSTGYIEPKSNEIRLLYFGGEIQRTALHEFVHLLTLQINPNFANNPRWLWEAVAIYKSEDYWFHMNNRSAIKGRFDGLVQDLYNKPNSSSAVYELGYTVGEFIERSWGEGAFVDLIKSNGDPSQLTDQPIESLFYDWEKFVKTTYLSGPKSEYEKAMERSPFDRRDTVN